MECMQALSVGLPDTLIGNEDVRSSEWDASMFIASGRELRCANECDSVGLALA